MFGAKHRKKQVKNDLIAQGQEGKGAAEKKVEEDVHCTMYMYERRSKRVGGW